MSNKDETVTKYFVNPEKPYKPKAQHNIESYKRVVKAIGDNGATKEELQTVLNYSEAAWKKKQASDSWKEAGGAAVKWGAKWQDHKNFITYLSKDKNAYLLTREVKA